MRLWGRVVSGIMVFIAAVFAGVAMLVPEARRESVIAAVILVVTALLGIPALLRLLMTLIGDEELLATGAPGSATITSLAPTGWRYNRRYPITRFRLQVEAGGSSYPVDIRQAVDPDVLRRLAPGTVVKVRVHRDDPRKVAIDLAESTV